MLQYFIDGLLIGIIFGVPAGVIGALTIQRTVSQGFWSGFITGAGSSAADVLYATVGLSCWNLIADRLFKYQMWINIGGGCFLLFFGIYIFGKRKDEKVDFKTDGKDSQLMQFSSAFVIAIMNPTALLSMLLAFSIFHVTRLAEIGQGAGLLIGIAAGTLFWWTALASLSACFKNRMTQKGMVILQHILGILLIIMGFGTMIRAFV